MADLTPCPCGSGLRQLRCCALDLAALSPPEATALLAPLLTQAEAALAAGDLAGAENQTRHLLELAPGHEEGLMLLHRTSRQQGRLPAAEALIRRVVTLNPNNFWATNELTLLLLSRGALAEAELHARNAIRIAPQNAQAHNLMGLVLTEANRPLIGEYHYRRVLELAEEEEPITLANLAWNLKNQGRIAESRALYQRSLALRPDVLQTVLGYAKMEEADRDFPRALALLDEAETLLPNSPSMQLTRATVLSRLKRHDEALAILHEPEDGRLRLGPAELSEKGRLLDQLGRHDEAFACFAQGKALALELGARPYMAEAAADMAARLKSFFIARRLAILPRAEPRADLPQPVFIVGFPRSGTTLLEQTLSVHPRISAGDELPYINDITQIMPRLLASPLAYPEALAELWMGDHRDGLAELRDHYLTRAAKSGIFREGADLFTDKMPLNETHLGLIHLLFPQAPIIHLLRHPLDVLLSVYSNHLTHGYFCAAQLETIARHYALTIDLVAHYRAQIPALRYLPLRYEDMVGAQEQTIRQALAFIGVAFDPRCLSFEKNTRYARTASYAQVTEKLYDRSKYRYKPYLKHLQPALEILRPLCERLGYEIEG
ncbi:tetratricopeptide repeat-containing sulfotransferase family protein [Acidocella sp.]|uniref:tetratricopeptide repeat-containing sulfotransferase family protein n=1 Tax=Acidocella sp. TaxID=50710 RepID=UPI00261DB0C8|nr:tetratricopeptide repeat-containing sulfotransferase family protein [Acidocella sp.]